MGRLLGDQRGMSAVEMLMTVCIMAVVTLGVYTVFEYGIWQYNYSEGRAAAQQDSRTAVDLISRYVRMTASIVTPDDETLTIQVDPDDDRAWETVRFYLSGGTLYMELTDGADVTERELARNVRNTTLFTYFDVEGAEISNLFDRPTKTKQIEIRLELDDNPNLPLQALSQGTIVELRNLQ
ncbi:MAG: PilW family protein [Candidatus Aquicultorales bacterium]